jgi:P pilus assembly chaperone PapD
MFPAITRLAALALFTSAVPCAAVGLGPLEKSGVTDGPAKAFYLSLANPYSTAERFVAEAVGPDDDAPQPRVLVFPSDTILGAGARRQLLVIVKGLAPGERYGFRLCAMRAPRPQETLHARVCSKLVARRLADRG